MANKKITELNAASSLAATDVVPVVDVSADETKKITATDLFRTLPDGTAAAPALAFSSDAANGVYLAGTDTVGISTGGTQRVTVDGSGNVTISGDLQVDGATTTVQSTTVTIDDKNIELGSVASPSNTTADGGGLTLKGASDKTLKWINSTGCWTFNQPMNFNDHVRIDSSGNVGIGTTSASDKLSVAGSSSGEFRALTLRNSSGSTNSTASLTFEASSGTEGDAAAIAAQIKGVRLGSGTNGGLQLWTANAGTPGERMRIDNSGRLLVGTSSEFGTVSRNSFYSLFQVKGNTSGASSDGRITLGTGATTGSNTSLGTIIFNDTDGGDRAFIRGYSASAGGSSNYPGYLTFWTNAGAPNPTERLRIDSSGNVGIGTSSPGTILNIRSDDSDDGILLEKTDGTDIARLFHDGTTTDARLDMFSGGSADIQLRANGVSHFSGGNVGIGTSSPTVELDVTGDARLRSTSTSDGPILQFDGAGPNGTNYTFGKIEADNTGSNNAGELRFYTNLASAGGLAQRMVIARDGKVGIGTTSPDVLLDCQGTGSQTIRARTNDTSGTAVGILRAEYAGGGGGTASNIEIRAGDGYSFVNNTTNSPMLFGINGSEKLRIDSSGRLLVGTSNNTAPGGFNAKLQIADTSFTGSISLRRDSDNAFAQSLVFGKSRGTLNSATVVQSGDKLGAIAFYGADGSDLNSEAAQISAQVDGTPGSNDMPGRLVFSTTEDGSSSAIERLRITSTGAWAIEGASNYGTSGQVLTSNGNDSPTWQDAAGGSTDSISEGNTSVECVDTGSDGHITFDTEGTERMRIDSSGNVGIGTSSPINSSGYRTLTIGDGSSSGGQIHLEAPSGNNYQQWHSDTGVNFYVNASVPLIFHTNASERMRIDSSGRIGIGTTSINATVDIKASSPEVRLTATGANRAAISHSASGLKLSQTGAANLLFETNGSERARIDSSGRLLVGVNTAFDTDSNALIQAVNSSGGEIVVGRDFALGEGSTIGRIGFFTKPSSVAEGARIEAVADGLHSGGAPTRLMFYTTATSASSPTEAMRITKDQRLFIGSTSSYDGAKVEIKQTGNANTLAVRATSGSYANDVLMIKADRNTTNGTFKAITYYNLGGGAQRFRVEDSGNVKNSNNSYGSLSDIKLKENIVDAGSQWDDLKAFRVRKYNFKADAGHSTHTQIGLIAQEAELVSPGLVSDDRDQDADGNDLGTVTKSVNYSVLYMKAVKALQEAMDRIETLETKVAALEAQ